MIQIETDPMFGVEKILRSGICEVFTPSTPVPSNIFCGRSKEASDIITSIVSSKSHVLLYGDRGVGKTSLAQYASQNLLDRRMISIQVFYKCVKNDTFQSIMHGVLSQLGVSIITKKTLATTKKGEIKGFGAGQSLSVEQDVYSDLGSPYWVANQLKDRNGIVIIDEFDTVSNIEEKKQIAQLLKILSDYKSNMFFMIVGIAVSAVELLAGHLSVARSLSEIKLNRMSDEELKQIILNGESRTGLIFDQCVKDAIVKASQGFPYFTHLLSLKSAEEAVKRDLTVIDQEIFNLGMLAAVEKIDASLKESYNLVVGENEMKRRVLYCAALLGNDVFTSKQLREKYKAVFGIELEQISVNNAIAKALSSSPDTILRKKRKGEYFFNDPRMPVYITMRQVKN